MKDNISQYRELQNKYNSIESEISQIEKSKSNIKRDIDNSNEKINNFKINKEQFVSDQVAQMISDLKRKKKDLGESVNSVRYDIKKCEENIKENEDYILELEREKETEQLKISQLNNCIAAMQNDSSDPILAKLNENYEYNLKQYSRVMPYSVIAKIKNNYQHITNPYSTTNPQIRKKFFVPTISLFRNYKTNKIIRYILKPFPITAINFVYLLLLGFLLSRFAKIPVIIIAAIFITLTIAEFFVARHFLEYDEITYSNAVKNGGYTSPYLLNLKNKQEEAFRCKDNIEQYENEIYDNKRNIKELNDKISELKLQLDQNQETYSNFSVAYKEESDKVRLIAEEKYENELKQMKESVKLCEQKIVDLNKDVQVRKEHQDSIFYDSQNLLKVMQTPPKSIGNGVLAPSLLLGFDIPSETKIKGTKPIDICTVDHNYNPVLIICNNKLLEDNASVTNAGNCIRKFIEGTLYTNYYGLMDQYFVDFVTARSILNSQLDRLVVTCEDKSHFNKIVENLDTANLKMLELSEKYGSKYIDQINQKILEDSNGENWFKYSFIYLFKYDNSIFSGTFEKLISTSKATGIIPIIFITKKEYDEYILHKEPANNLEKFLRACSGTLKIYNYDEQNEICIPVN